MPASTPTGSSSSNGFTRASPPSAPSLPVEQCLTPPSVRRREARLVRCAYVPPSEAGRRDTVGPGGDGDGAVTDEEAPARRAYGAEEVDARRAGARAAQWGGWEAEAELYEGQQGAVQEGGGVVRPDGTVDWAALDALPSTAEGQAFESFDAADFAATESYTRELEDGPATLPSPPSTIAAGRLTLPSLPSGLDTTQLPSNTLPLVLGALYVAARAFGVGSRRPAAENGVEGKVRRF
ncbi:hypothetical protein JCM8547_003717 [Rhodosporidiobolus lusitaniae]